MDVSLAPKLIAAALVGVAATATLPRLNPNADTIMLKMEWVRSGGNKLSEAIHLRASLDKPTIVRQGNRMVEAKTTLSGDGGYYVNLKIVTDPPVATKLKEERESLDTEIHVTPGETVVVMGTTRKEGKSGTENLFFVTATPIEGR